MRSQWQESATTKAVGFCPDLLCAGGGGLLVLLLAVSPLLGQEFQIRATVDLVVVPFSAKGEGDALIAGLEADDFTVLEDGVEQTIERFSIDPIPLSAAVVIDTGVAPDSLAAIQEAIPAIVFGFSAFDEVTLFRYDNTVVQVQDFTEDPDVLRTALDELKDYRPVTQFYPRAPVQPGPVINGIPSITTASTPATADKRVLHDAVWEAGLALRDRPDDRRKIIVLLADGNATRSNRTLEQTQLFLIEHEIQVYPIGLDNNFFTRLTGQISGSLDDYARLTGGDLYHIGSDRLAETFPRVTEQARNQYVLTYISSNEAPSDTIVFRRIELLSEEPYDVVHRAGYYHAPR